MKRLGPPPHSCLITEGLATAQNFESEKAKILATTLEAAADGVGMVQVREKALSGRRLFELVSSAVKTLADTSTLVIVNDRPDVALATGADGVHLPANSFPADVVRRVFGKDLLIGVSTHSSADVSAAASSGADYIFFGPVFETPGKGSPVGISNLSEAAHRAGSLPVIALGGIDGDNFDRAMAAGARGVAAIRAFNVSESRRRICSGLSTIQFV